MNYRRVIPRDLFNEAKLLKCLGLLSLRVHENAGPICDRLNIVLEDELSGFKIMQHIDGSIGCINFFLFNNNGTPVFLSTPLNSKLNYPLLFETLSFGEQICEFVFNDEGEFTEDFLKTLID